MANNIRYVDSENYNKHFCLNERMQVLQFIHKFHQGKEITQLKQIGQIMKKDPTTISKEVKRNRIYVPYKTSFDSLNNKVCASFKTCNKKQLCKYCGKYNKVLCKSCIKCIEACPDYDEYVCPKLTKFPWVCDGCEELKKRCPYNKYRYYPIESHKVYLNTLKECREGIILSEEEFDTLDDLISPLITEKGQTIAHIVQTYWDKLVVSERTIYNYFENNLFRAKNIDLPRKVKYKPRKKACIPANVRRKNKEGRLYEDYLKFIEANSELGVVQMDCVEGKTTDSVRILTLYFKTIHFMLGFIIPNKESISVLNKFNDLEGTLGLEMFKYMFPLILTDNGTEFSNPQKLETSSITNENRTKIFYCHANASYEKGACENNHRYIRYILPKGKSFEGLTQEKINLIFSHINSTKRHSTSRATPYDLACVLFGEETLNKLGIKKINPEDVTLKPNLLK